MKFKNYIFDCGNVLFSFSKQLLLEIYVENKEDWPLLGEVLYKNWELQDKGMESNEFYNILCDQLPERLHEAMYNIVFHWDLWIKPFEDIRELIIKLKNTGHKLYVISNMPSTFSNDHSKLPVLEEFDGLVFSYLERMVKPDPEIFRLTLKRFNLDPNECIFIDDSLDNCKGAELVGIKSYLFDKTKRSEFIHFVNEIEDIKK